LIAPRPKTRLFPGKEDQDHPGAAEDRLEQFIRAAASRILSCGRGIRNAPGGRTQLPIREAGKRASAKKRGPRLPKRQTSRPAAIMAAKPARRSTAAEVPDSRRVEERPRYQADGVEAK
jgi:hypothetical protein